MEAFARAALASVFEAASNATESESLASLDREVNTTREEGPANVLICYQNVDLIRMREPLSRLSGTEYSSCTHSGMIFLALPSSSSMCSDESFMMSLLRQITFSIAFTNNVREGHDEGKERSREIFKVRQRSRHRLEMLPQRSIILASVSAVSMSPSRPEQLTIHRPLAIGFCGILNESNLGSARM